ncbi:hypothetical protein [Pseudomonas sp. MPB26]|uniref:hypothetical protein n=1 Tax=Pseudomonas sp. MPB26 TaxID=3388491 RepID=UPI003984D658
MALQIITVTDLKGNTIPDRGRTQEVNLQFSVETDSPLQRFMLRVSKSVLGQGATDGQSRAIIEIDVTHLPKAMHSFNVARSDSEFSEGYLIELIS